jgi:hypothetical protein
VTDQPRHPHPRPGALRPLRAARRALTVLGALLLSLAAVTPAASATPAPPEPPAGPPPPPPALPAPGLPLWAVLVILGGTIALSAATTLITLALQPTAPSRGPRPPARAPAPAMHQPLPLATPAARDHTRTAIPVKDSGLSSANARQRGPAQRPHRGDHDAPDPSPTKYPRPGPPIPPGAGGHTELCPRPG